MTRKLNALTLSRLHDRLIGKRGRVGKRQIGNARERENEVDKKVFACLSGGAENALAIVRSIDGSSLLGWMD